MPFFKRWNNWIKIAYSISDISYGAIEMNRFTEPYIRMPEEYKQKMPFYQIGRAACRERVLQLLWFNSLWACN